MIVRNEESHLEACLNSAHRSVDEIVVVDTGSTDTTKSIARRFTQKVFDFEWIDDFSAARNCAASHAQSDWIIFLDADERMLPTSWVRLLEAIKDPNIHGFRLEVLNYRREKHWHPIDLIPECLETQDCFHSFILNFSPRVYRNRQQIEWRSCVHETFLPSMRDLNLPYTDLRGAFIHHIGGGRAQEDLDRKLRYYLKLLLMKVRNQPENKNAWLELGLTFTELQFLDKALVAYDRASQLAPDWEEPRKNAERIREHLGLGVK